VDAGEKPRENAGEGPGLPGASSTLAPTKGDTRFHDLSMPKAFFGEVEGVDAHAGESLHLRTERRLVEGERGEHAVLRIGPHGVAGNQEKGLVAVSKGWSMPITGRRATSRLYSSASS
jgi:hypothetical protein